MTIAVYREGERAERGEATLDEAAEALSVSPATVRRLIADSVLPASQQCKGAPVRHSDSRSSAVGSRQRGNQAKKAFAAASAV